MNVDLRFHPINYTFLIRSTKSEMKDEQNSWVEVEKWVKTWRNVAVLAIFFLLISSVICRELLKQFQRFYTRNYIELSGKYFCRISRDRSSHKDRARLENVVKLKGTSQITRGNRIFHIHREL